MPTSKRAAVLAAGLVALYLLYGWGLDRAGMLSADEPRYAAIGRAMADSGDWITPRLWDRAWFEKPPLLYWMTALGFRAGLNPDLAPRVPVALASVGFLLFFYFVLRREFGVRAALYSTAMLATSAGWLTYSHVGVTDLPLAVCFSIAMLLLMPGTVPSKPGWAGVFLGLAVLAKGLVPLMLIVPAGWFLRKRWKDAAALLTAALAVAVPWYALAIARNGQPFIDEFFWKQHFARFTSGSLQHVRPIWFYVPVLLAGAFPWTPLLALLFRRGVYKDRRARYLLAWAAFGFVFFSLAENKLPGYVLPLLPAVAALVGIELAQVRFAAGLLGCAAALLWMVPAIAELLPAALLNGATRVSLDVPARLLVAGLLTGLAVYWGCRRVSNAAGVAAVSAGAVVGVTYLIATTLPVLDHTVSARQFSRTHPAIECIVSGTRAWRYGLDYYARREIPDCDPEP